jgi:hypothetical protein
MTVDPKAGGEGGGAAAAEPVTPSAPKTEPAAPPAGETPEQEVVRLRAENEAHRKTQAEWQPKVEEANRVLEERKARGVQPSPTAPSADPLEAEIQNAAGEYQRAQDALRQYPDDPGYRAAARIAAGDLQAAQGRKLVRQVTPFFMSIKDEGLRARSYEIWRSSGGAMAPDVALAAAKGETAPDETKVSKIEKELEETKKDLAAARKGVFTGGGVPPGMGSPVLTPKPTRTVQQGTKNVKVFSRDEWKKIDTLPRDEKIKLLRDYKNGEVLVE